MDVLVAQVRMICKDLLTIGPRRAGPQSSPRHAEVSDARNSAHSLRVDGDSVEAAHLLFLGTVKHQAEVPTD